MNADPENFENLRKLLALKRHEQPPPGYFDRLPQTILSRIEAGERPSESFWERLLPRIILRPAFAYGFGMAACVMLALGGYHALRTEPSPATANGLSAPVAVVRQDPINPQLVAASAPAPVVTNDNLSSTNPVITEKPLFPAPTLRVAPANFNRPNP